MYDYPVIIIVPCILPRRKRLTLVFDAQITRRCDREKLVAKGYIE